MERPVLFALCLAIAGCGFYATKTPVGGFCSDMPLIGADSPVSNEYHRGKPIQSPPTAATLPEKMEALRRLACKVGGIAVVDVARRTLPGGGDFILVGTVALRPE